MDTELLFQVMSEKELDIEKRVLALIENIDEDLYADVTARLTEIDAESKLKIAFVGLDKKSKRRLKNELKGKGFVVNFLEGLEDAKQWLL